MPQKNNFGFTLVEISIVMIIIGLLIGGVFGGLAMVENMKVNSTIQQMKKFQAVALNFKEVYGFYPGDLRNPTEVLPNCTGPCSIAGDQNGVIGDPWHGWFTATSWVKEQPIFWHHLAAVSMIEGLDATSFPGVTFGVHIPISPFDAGYVLFYDGNLGENTDKHGVMITNIEHNSGIAFNGTTDNHLVLPGSAANSIDLKLDDGNPMIGVVRSWNASPAAATYNINTNYGLRYLYNF